MFSFVRSRITLLPIKSDAFFQKFITMSSKLRVKLQDRLLIYTMRTSIYNISTNNTELNRMNTSEFIFLAVID